MFFFGEKAYEVPRDNFIKENYKLADICEKRFDCFIRCYSSFSTDLSVQTLEEIPLNLVEVALKYKNEVESVVGKSYTKRLRYLLCLIFEK